MNKPQLQTHPNDLHNLAEAKVSNLKEWFEIPRPILAHPRYPPS